MSMGAREYPVVPATSLSEDAQTLYRVGGRTALTLDRDWLAPDAARMSKYAVREERRLDPNFEPSPRLLEAARELTEAGYLTPAWVGESEHVYTRTLTTPSYTVAHGSGEWLVRLSRVSAPGVQEGELAAVLDGASITSGVDSVTVWAAVPGALDGEHGQAHSAIVTILLPSFPRFAGASFELWGVAGDAHLYPLGTQPTLLDAHDSSPIDEPVVCAEEWCKREPHVFAPYAPPLVGLGGGILHVEAFMKNVA